MKIGVLIKQVPATEKVKMDEETGTMVRKGLELELNPLDMYAVEEAIRLKEKLKKNVEITVISMGPPSAIEAIKDAISMGCDKGYLISDRKFAGSDTLATAYILSMAIKALGGFDIIITGERATDGETGQVGPSVAAQLDIPALTYINKIEEINEERVRVCREVEGGYEILEAFPPLLLSVIKGINEPRLPNLVGKIKARNFNVPILSKDDLKVDSSRIGLSGSPTRVKKIFYPKLSRTGKIIKAKNSEDAVSELIHFFKDKGIVGGLK